MSQPNVIRYLHTDLKNRVPLNTDFDLKSNNDLLIIPLKGNKALYTCTEAETVNDRYEVPVILNFDTSSNLFTHIYCSSSAGFEQHYAVTINDDNAVAISDLTHDVSNPNIVYIPIYVPGPNRNRCCCFYLCIAADYDELDPLTGCQSIIYLYYPECVVADNGYTGLYTSWDYSTKHFYCCQQPLRGADYTEGSGSLFIRNNNELFHPIYYNQDDSSSSTHFYDASAISTSFRFVDAENLVPYDWSRTLFSGGSNILPEGTIAFRHLPSGEIVKKVVQPGALLRTLQFDNLRYNGNEFQQTLTNVSLDEYVASGKSTNIIIDFTHTTQYPDPVTERFPYKKITFVTDSPLTVCSGTGTYYTSYDVDEWTSTIDFRLIWVYDSEYNWWQVTLDISGLSDYSSSTCSAEVNIYNPSDYAGSVLE